jgi:tyrosyl-tRNA synthetase
MSVTNIASDLKARGLIAHEGGGEAEAFLAEPRKVYLGVDPTAESLHVGNLVPMMVLRHLAEAGHEVHMLVGGATGMIGDPRESGERTLLDPEITARNTANITAQVERILAGKVSGVYNNHDWLKEVSILDFLRDTGKHFTVNQLVKREIIKKRLDEEDPLSFTEFSYSLLQAYDFLHLHRTHGIDLQVGGSDQWANIISGVDLIRRKENTPTYALTVPMIIDATSGKKFGKSEGNAVWLDPAKVPPFSFYQFWFNTADENVEAYLKIFTLMLVGDIQALVEEHRSHPQDRTAQKKLAYEVTAMLHGEDAARGAERASVAVYGAVDASTTLSAEEMAMLKEGIPGGSITQAHAQEGIAILDALTLSGLAPSKSEAKRLVTGGAVQVNGIHVSAPEHTLTFDTFVHGALILRAGKRVAVLSLEG